MAKILRVTNIFLPDIEADISFMCTRVLKTTKYYKNNLKRLLQLLNFIIEDDHIIGADNLQNLEFWV